MTPQEEELVRKFMQKLEDQLAVIVEFSENVATLLASIDRKLARMESLRAPTYVVRHDEPRWRAGRWCSASWTRRRGCHGR